MSNNSKDIIGNFNSDDDCSSNISFLQSSQNTDRKQKVAVSESLSPERNQMKRQTKQKKQQQNKQKTKESSVQGGTKLGTKRKAQSKHEDLEKIQKKQNNAAAKEPKVGATFLYYPGERYPDLSEYTSTQIEIRIATEYCSKYNKYFIERALWGNDSYTSESDAVCMLVHQGFIDNQFKDKRLDENECISMQCKVTKTRRNYQAHLRYGFLSRAHKNHLGFSIKPENIEFVKSLGTEEELREWASKMPSWNASRRIKTKQQIPNYKYLQTIPEVNLIFNLNNEPAYKYSCMNICDKGSDSKTWKSFKLKTQVLYLDTENNERYEISRVDTSQQPEDEEYNLFKDIDQYRFAKIKEPYEMDNYFMEQQQRPLIEQYIDILFDELDWSDFKWGSTILTVKDKVIEGIKSFKYYTISD